MKRLIAFLLALTMLFALAACSAKTETADAAAPSETASNDSAASSGTTRLVLGTSTTGSTYYILGTGWADVMKSAVPGVEISIEATPRRHHQHAVHALRRYGHGHDHQLAGRRRLGRNLLG